MADEDEPQITIIGGTFRNAGVDNIHIGTGMGKVKIVDVDASGAGRHNFYSASEPPAQTANDDEGPTNYRSIHRHWIRPIAVGVLIIALGGIVFIWMTGSPPPK